VSHFRCELVQHSVTTAGLEAITYSVCYERKIHADVMTYRWGRNGSSSRATPYNRMRDWIKESPAMPLHLGRGRPGMSCGQEVDDPVEAETVIKEMLGEMVGSCNYLVKKLNLHKELVNRYLEPWGWINSVMTMGRPQLMNAFKQRISPKAGCNVQRLFVRMARLYRASKPRLLLPGEWHIPFILDEERDLPVEDKLVWSVARAAWTSYRTADGRVAEWADAKGRHDDCVIKKHMTPLEHQLRAGDTRGCVPGYEQYRKMIPGECEDCDLDALLDGPYRDVDYIVG
jgi:hypothetical protein